MRCRVVALFLLLFLASGCQFNRSFETISPRQMFSSERHRREGITLLEQGDLSKAERSLENAVKLNKNDTNHRIYYAEALWQQNKHLEALEQLEEALKRGGSENAALHIAIAEKNLMLGNHDTAELHANEAVRLDALNFRSWALRGKSKRLKASQQAGYIENSLFLLNQAKEDYIWAVSLSPNNRELLIELASVQMNCQQPEQALATWLTVQKLYPQGAEPTEMLLGMAETLTVLNRFEEASANMLVLQQRGQRNFEAEQRLRERMAATLGSVQR